MRSEKELLERLEWLRNQEAFHFSEGNKKTAELYWHAMYEIKFALGYTGWWRNSPDRSLPVKEQVRDWFKYKVALDMAKFRKAMAGKKGAGFIK